MESGNDFDKSFDGSPTVIAMSGRNTESVRERTKSHDMAPLDNRASHKDKDIFQKSVSQYDSNPDTRSGSLGSKLGKSRRVVYVPPAKFESINEEDEFSYKRKKQSASNAGWGPKNKDYYAHEETEVNVVDPETLKAAVEADRLRKE